MGSAGSSDENAQKEKSVVRSLGGLVEDIKSCRHCILNPSGPPLGHEPRPVLVASTYAKICIIGQAPGTRVHASGKPFTDPSGDRLREWLGVSSREFYNQKLFSIIPMGFCFPGLNDKGADLPPRKECAEKWQDELFERMPQIELKLLVGMYAQRWHLGKRRKKTLSETVRCWREYLPRKQDEAREPAVLPMPHPSWRNNAWLRKNPFFERDVIPYLRGEVARLIGKE